MSFLFNKMFALTRRVWSSQSHLLTSSRLFSTPFSAQPTVELPPVSSAESAERKDIFDKVNKLIGSGETGRLFAVVQLCGKQFKVTDGDIILVEGNWPPTVGDRIRLEKVLLVGARDFSLIGAPMLESSLVDVQATVVEKTLSHTKTHFRKKRRKQYMRTNFFRPYHTMLRINSIDLRSLVGERKSEAESSPRRLF